MALPVCPGMEEHMDINISGVSKPRLLAALYNNARPQGFGLLHAEQRDMTAEEAEALLVDYTHGGAVVWFDYLKGRPIKVGFDGDTLRRADLYDRDAPGGLGSVQRIVDAIWNGTSEVTP